MLEERWAPAPAGPLCVYLHGVRDPGNVGAVLRSALAFGAASVALGPDCADPFGPKAVRACMGAVFAVPVARAAAVDELPGERVALVARARRAAARPGGCETVSLVVGAEREGLPRRGGRRLRPGRSHPHPLGVAERGDGRDASRCTS